MHCIVSFTANLENTDLSSSHLGCPLNDNILCDIGEYLPSSAINKKVSLWLGDITRLEIDAVVSSVTRSQVTSAGTSSPGSVQFALHEAAGPLLEKECRQLRDCIPGYAKVTFGYDLPAKCKCIF